MERDLQSESDVDIVSEAMESKVEVGDDDGGRVFGGLVLRRGRPLEETDLGSV